MANLFEVSVYDAARKFVCMVEDRKHFEVAPVHNQIGSALLSVTNEHPALPDLMTAGTTLRVRHKGKLILSGTVDSEKGVGYLANGDVSFTIVDHKAFLWSTLCYPVPNKALTAQTSEYYTATGPAETVFKNLVKANAVNRDAVPGVVVAPDLGRGPTITVQLRFDSIGEVVVPMLDAAGLGVSAFMGTTGDVVVDVYEPDTYPLTFSMEAGTLKEREWMRRVPGATRVVIGGVGEGVDRIFDSVIDTDREAQYGMRKETFIDATNTGKMVTDQWKLIEDAQSAVDSASSGIQGPANTRSDARSKLDAATAERKSALAALEAAAAAHEISMLRNVAAEKAITLPLYTAANSKSSSASSALDSAQTAYDTANSNYSTASSNLSSARSALTSAKNALAGKITAHRTELRALGSLHLAQNGAKAGLTLKFAETSVFTYGGEDGAHVGDTIRVKIGNGLIVEDVMRTAVLVEKSPKHAETLPGVGEFTLTDPNAVVTEIVGFDRKRINKSERNR